MNKLTWGRAARWLIVPLGILAVLMAFSLFASTSLWYTETKGPFKNHTQVVDWDGDSDLDVIVSHTRWERDDISWAGVGIWVNQGDGGFELQRDRGTGTWPFTGFAAGAGDVDRDGDVDLFTQDFAIHLQVNQGGDQAGEAGEFLSLGGIDNPVGYDSGYRDMGGTIAMGDLNGDSRIDAFVAGCCYGSNAGREMNQDLHGPAISWVWINDGGLGSTQTGHILPLEFLNGRPIREVALGDVDGDGDQDVFAAVGKPTMGSLDSVADLVLLNDGTGRLQPYGQGLGETDSTSVALGDVDGDGHLDALVGTDSGAVLWIGQGRGSGGGGPLFRASEQTFGAERSLTDWLLAGVSQIANRFLGLYIPFGGIRTKAVILADLDGDGDLDAVLARIWGAEVWWNDGSEYRRSDLRFAYGEDTGVAVADFNGDGYPDIFAGNNEDDFRVWFNQGGGEFIAGD